MKKLLFLTAALAVVAPFCRADERELERKTARVLYELAPKKSRSEASEAYNLTYALASLGAFEGAKIVAQGAPAARDAAFSMTAQRKIAFGKLDEALVLARRVHSRRSRVDVLSQIAQAHIARGNLKIARDLLFEIASQPRIGAEKNPNLARLFAKAGDLPAAKRIFDRAEKAAAAGVVYVKGDAPFQITQADFVAESLVLSGFAARGVALTRKLRLKSGLTENALLVRGESALALRLARENPSPSWRALVLTQCALDLLVSGDEKTARSIVKEAEKSLRLSWSKNSKEDSRFPTEAVYRALIRVGETEAAGELLDEARKRLGRNTAREIEASTLLIEIQYASLDVQKLRDLKREWSDENMPDEKSSDEFSRILSRDDFWLPVLSANLTRAYLRQNETAKARETIAFLEEFVRRNEALPDFQRSPSTPNWAQIAAFYRELGDDAAMEKALEAHRLSAAKEARNNFQKATQLMSEGFVSQARALVLLDDFREPSIARTWGTHEGEALKIVKSRPDFVDWSANLPSKSRRAALTSYAFSLSHRWQAKPEARYEIDIWQQIPNDEDHWGGDVSAMSSVF